jgi:hypothetical protein
MPAEPAVNYGRSSKSSPRMRHALAHANDADVVSSRYAVAFKHAQRDGTGLCRRATPIGHTRIYLANFDRLDWSALKMDERASEIVDALLLRLPASEKLSRNLC